MYNKYQTCLGMSSSQTAFAHLIGFSSMTTYVLLNLTSIGLLDLMLISSTASSNSRLKKKIGEIHVWLNDTYDLTSTY